MLISETGTSARWGSEELLDRVVQLRRLSSGATSQNTRPRRGAMRLRRADRTLERELHNVVRARRRFRTHQPAGSA